MTSETQLVMANPSGSFTLTENSRPVRVRRGSGWVPVDLTLVRGSDGSVSAAAAPTLVVFSGGGAGSLVRIGSGAASVALTWPGGSVPAPTLSGDTATYANVLPDVDLRLTADVDGYSEVLVVKTATAAANPALRTLRFGLSSTGVTAAKDRAGNIDFRDSTGSVVFHVPTPTMWDSPAPAAKAAADDTPGDEPTRATMAVDVSSAALTVTPDQAMLTAPGTQFPVDLTVAVGGPPGLDHGVAGLSFHVVLEFVGECGAGGTRVGPGQHEPVVVLDGDPGGQPQAHLVGDVPRGQHLLVVLQPAGAGFVVDGRDFVVDDLEFAAGLDAQDRLGERVKRLRLVVPAGIWNSTHCRR